jgi:hypothetical protein
MLKHLSSTSSAKDNWAMSQREAIVTAIAFLAVCVAGIVITITCWGFQ